MSTYYSAYLGKKTKDGKYEIIGPYVYNKNNELKLNSMWWRSQSFIHWDDWPVEKISIEAMGEKTKEICVYESGFNDDEVWSIGYWIPASKIYANGSCEPIRGYLPVEEAQGLIAANYDQEYISWELEERPLSAEFVAGMTDSERSKYSFVSYVDYSSTKYHMWEVSRILNGYEEYGLLNEDEELGVIFQVG